MFGTDPLSKLPTDIKLFMRNLHTLVPDKLTDTNYPAWALNVTTALSAHLLFNWVNGDDKAPPEKLQKDGGQIDNPDFALWTLIDTQIRACLLAILIPSVHKHARGFTSSVSLWAALAARYNSLSEAHIFQLRDRVHTLQKGSKTMTQYLDEMASILSDLDAINEIIPEWDVINAVVRGLPADYSSFKQHVRMNEASLTLAQISGWLGAEELNLEFEQKLTMAESSTGGTHTALYTAGGGRGQQDKRRSGSRSRTQQSGRGSGSVQRYSQPHHGRGGGRSSRGGPYRGGGGRGSQGRELPVSQICDKRGHSAASCWYRYDESTADSSSSGGSRAMQRPQAPKTVFGTLTRVPTLTSPLISPGYTLPLPILATTLFW
ncbi:unnamed protein product [Cuscuta campestris]|uniref:Retrotransposon Copia-like N-terminal domain-containing protein n=1 Tax=Cuscuta campestris TaxID=132261 RepID=A0A484KSL3_9ASTE|nr:unnamed protein product [Cuscuta campestris]